MADKKEARVLADNGEHKVNDIITGDEAAAAVAAGWADDHASAVAYAKKLAKQLPDEA